MKERILDTLKMIGVVFGCILLFFIFVASVSDDDPDEDYYEAIERTRSETWVEAYHEGFDDGVAEAQDGNAFVVDENYLRGYDVGYYDGYQDGQRVYPWDTVTEELNEIDLDEIVDYLIGAYNVELVECFAEYGFILKEAE